MRVIRLNPGTQFTIQAIEIEGVIAYWFDDFTIFSLDIFLFSAAQNKTKEKITNVISCNHKIEITGVKCDDELKVNFRCNQSHFDLIDFQVLDEITHRLVETAGMTHQT